MGTCIKCGKVASVTVMIDQLCPSCINPELEATTITETEQKTLIKEYETKIPSAVGWLNIFSWFILICSFIVGGIIWFYNYLYCKSYQCRQE